MQKGDHLILNSVIEECRKHLLRLNFAYHKLLRETPFTVKSNLSDEIIASLDQYIYRFSKLQDTIGQKLFKSVLQFLGEESSDKPFLDIFNRLEQLGIIADYDQWNELRIIRNQIAHEYDEHKAELVEKINKIIDSKIKLERYLEDILVYLKSRGFNNDINESRWTNAEK